MPRHQENYKFELLKADDYSQYLLRDPREVLQILRRLIEKRAMVSAYYDGGESFLTTLLGISDDENTIILDPSSDEHANDRALSTDQLICITQLDSVKIQFPATAVTSVTYEGYPALRALRPDILLRLQRREYYRLIAPAAHSLTCNIPIKNGGSDVQSYDARVIDLSGGGVAVMVPPAGMDFSPDAEFPDCRITLPEMGPIIATLRVRNVFRLTNRNGVVMLRAGCEFVGLPSNTSSLIHRYILRVERERSAREKGL